MDFIMLHKQRCHRQDPEAFLYVKQKKRCVMVGFYGNYNLLIRRCPIVTENIKIDKEHISKIMHMTITDIQKYTIKTEDWQDI